MDSDRKCKFHRFCPARSDCNNKAHAILSCYKLQEAFNQFNEKIWKLQQKYFSYKRDQRRSFASTFICMSKFTNLYKRILKMQALKYYQLSSQILEYKLSLFWSGHFGPDMEKIKQLSKCFSHRNTFRNIGNVVKVLVGTQSTRENVRP